MVGKVLVIEDNENEARLLEGALRTDGFDVTTVWSQRLALQHLAQHEVDSVLLDYRLPDAEGLECLRKLRTLHPDTPVIVITGWGSEEVAVEAIKLGAADYVTKRGKFLPCVVVKVREVIGHRTLARATAHYRNALSTQRREVKRLQRALRENYRLDGIIGSSPAIEQALVEADLAAQSHVTVLIEGESGTGKELFARCIHYHGPRSAGPFEAINCAALPESLHESLLFGYVRGAFTGADRDQRGLFDQADGGSIFLDEIGEMSLETQKVLLRVLDAGEVRPLGGKVSRHVDVRVIAATNRDLRQAVRDGRFRLDLYHRLSVFPMRLPPLRERPADIAPLAQHFLRQVAAAEGKPVPRIAPDALALLERHSWPGNIRQLKNEITRLLLLAAGGKITSEIVSPDIRDGDPALAADDRPLEEIIRQVKTSVIVDRLRRSGNRPTQAARSLGISREWLWALMRKLGLKPPDEDDDPE